MVKHFNVIMAGLISGIVALFTSWLGISGTVIGSVLSSFLYQFFSSYSAEKYEERLEEGRSFSQAISNQSYQPNIGSEIVYVFPIVVIAIIEVICVLSALHYRFDMLFDLLEAAVSNNLFRLMGLGLIALGVYPLIRDTNIEKINGKILLVLGIFLLLRGLIDISDITLKLYYMVFQRFDFIFSVIVVLGLVFVIFNVLRNSAGEYLYNKEKDHYVEDFDNEPHQRFSRPHRKSKARKIDTSFTNGENGSDKINREHNSSYDSGYDSGYDSSYDSGYNSSQDHNNRNINNGSVGEDLPIYEEEIIYVTNPEDPNNPIRKRILKRVNPNQYGENYDDYDETYIIDDN